MYPERHDSSIIIDHFERAAGESRICIGFIYFRYSDSATHSVRHCLEILVKQIIERDSACLELAEDLYAEHIRLKTLPAEAELLQLLRRFTTVVGATYYFLDAIDEAPTRTQVDLLAALDTLNAKVFITSRPLKLLQAQFPDAHRFQISPHAHDIELHIQEEIQRSPGFCRVLQEMDIPRREQALTAIKEKSGGM